MGKDPVERIWRRAGLKIPKKQPKCGRAAMWSEYGGIETLRFVRVGTLDDPAAIPPNVHIYVRSKLRWLTLPEGVPRFEAYYDSPKLWPAVILKRRRAILG